MKPQKIKTQESILVPMGEIGDAQVSAYFENAEVLSTILIVNLISIIGFFLKTGWEMWKKKNDKSEEKLNQTNDSIIELQSEMKIIISKLDLMSERISDLDHNVDKKIELQVLRHFTEMKRQ